MKGVRRIAEKALFPNFNFTLRIFNFTLRENTVNWNFDVSSSRVACAVVAGYASGVEEGKHPSKISSFSRQLISFEGCPGDREFAFTLDRQSDGRQPFEVIGIQCPIVDHHFINQPFEVSGTAAFVPSEL